MSYTTLPDPFPVEWDALTQEFVPLPVTLPTEEELAIFRRNEEAALQTRLAGEPVNLVVTKTKVQLQAEMAQFEKEGFGHIWYDPDNRSY